MAGAHGAVIAGDHAELPGAVARALLTGWGAQLDEAGLVLASFTTLDTDAPWPVHLWAGAGAEMTAAAALDALMASVGGTWTDRPTGGLAVYRVRRAAGDPLIAFDDGQIVEGSWEWVPMPREVRPAVTMGANLRLTHAREGVAEQLALVVGIGFDSRRHNVTLDVLLEPGT